MICSGALSSRRRRIRDLPDLSRVEFTEANPNIIPTQVRRRRIVTLRSTTPSIGPPPSSPRSRGLREQDHPRGLRVGEQRTGGVPGRSVVRSRQAAKDNMQLGSGRRQPAREWVAHLCRSVVSVGPVPVSIQGGRSRHHSVRSPAYRASRHRFTGLDVRMRPLGGLWSCSWTPKR